ncbi:MAG: hypothetical protein KJ728_04485 [Alphaproteobacteria bacterium]|uniref:hypothetical protein n=1 Tax=Brevundimonas sp. TaxID=1871086 RepID=UPI001A18402A|nr:hypothetical protein [Brevundimonas sp.]MBU1270690.1 hypothetical protein [Alphaproteobacteria bacterium]MBJ7319574.1 hypothetical protein [Brevundimonas sp.]MBU1520661.1 hypothetical protein [Alphaproteobacteria bacterium]MBU2030460.1 hypothetical protein [Alphaproteobacteria bacterium]MBU2164874.1 hypothetical protein [Alphaproteobacteria bacterium]
MSQEDSQSPVIAPTMTSPPPSPEPEPQPVEQPHDLAPADAPETARAAPPNPTPTDTPAVSDEGVLRPIQESDYFTLDDASIAKISGNIDLYFNQPLDIFPFWENEKKPDRFHVLFARQIEERFPADRDIRGRVHAYGRRIFGALCVHVGVKRLTQVLALIAFAVLAEMGPTLFADWAGGQPAGLGLGLLAMLVTGGIFFGVSTILFIQYRFRLENDSYELSREIVQRTRELQNLFTNARALSDQAETTYQMDGKAWGQRALYLTRLVMWIGARMEYLEKFIQMELWRVRRERYWMRWFGRITTPAVLVIWLVFFIFFPAPAANEIGFRILQIIAVLLACGVTWLSYFRWQTPAQAIQDKLGAEGWVRYASLDVDNTVGDQVRRDKERLVEYRALTRGR